MFPLTKHQTLAEIIGIQRFIHFFVAAQYFDADGLSEPIGFPDLPEAPPLPSAHHVSKTFFILQKHTWQPHTSDSSYSYMVMQWGQFIDHDIAMTAESEGAHHCIFPRYKGIKKIISFACLQYSYYRIETSCNMKLMLER